MNICQIHGTVGQQVVAGKRIQFRTDPGARTLPCFEQGNDDPKSRGFVRSSYTKGLDVAEYWTHHMGGREGLIDTACKTAETGYLQRRMGKILESEHACTDGSVRDAHGNIILPKYGGDTMGSELLLKVRLTVLTKIGYTEDVARRWCGEEGEESLVLSYALYMVRKALLHFYPKCPGHLYLPFDPWDHVPKQEEVEPITAEACRAEVGRAELKIVAIVGEELSCINMLLALRVAFVSKRLKNVSPKTLRGALDIILDKIGLCQVPNGEMVGVIAAQSIGEPATQMVSKSFFYRPKKT